MSKSAKRNALEELHKMLAETLTEDLRQAKEDGIPLPAANLNAIRQFLKDNDITADIEAEDMAELHSEFEQEMAAARQRKRDAVSNALSDDDMERLLQ